MPGGDREPYDESVRPIFEAIAAQVDGTPCCTYVGPDGAGHYVKMVHNGIEYADMQLIAESYDLLRHARRARGPGDRAGVRALERVGARVVPDRDLGARARQDRRGDRPAAGRRDPRRRRAEGHGPLDRPERARARRPADRDHRGGVRADAERAEGRARVAAAGRLAGPGARRSRRDAQLADDLEHALYASKIVSYAQGFAQMAAASDDEGWDLDLGAMATIWRGGCIIRARFLDRIREAYDAEPDLREPDAGRVLRRALWSAPRIRGAGSSRAPPSWGSRRRPSPPRWPTTTATGAPAGRRA